MTQFSLTSRVCGESANEYTKRRLEKAKELEAAWQTGEWRATNSGDGLFVGTEMVAYIARY